MFGVAAFSWFSLFTLRVHSWQPKGIYQTETMGSAGIGDTLLIFQSPDHMRETLCLQTCGLIYAPYGPTRHLFSWNTGLPRVCLQDGCWTPRSGHTGSSGQWLGSALPADGIQPCPFLLTHFFNWLISGGIHWCPLVEYPGLGALQVNLALSDSSTSCPFPVLSICKHNAYPGQLGPCCLSAVQATNVSSQVVSWFCCFLPSSVDSAWETAWAFRLRSALSSMPSHSSQRLQLHLEWTPTQTFKASSAAPGYAPNLISHTCSLPLCSRFLLTPPNTFSTWAIWTHRFLLEVSQLHGYHG